MTTPSALTSRDPGGALEDIVEDSCTGDPTVMLVLEIVIIATLLTTVLMALVVAVLTFRAAVKARRRREEINTQVGKRKKRLHNHVSNST